jgi:hypothetical protein
MIKIMFYADVRHLVGELGNLHLLHQRTRTRLNECPIPFTLHKHPRCTSFSRRIPLFSAWRTVRR